MRKRIDRSLTAKLFLITSLLLVFVCVLTYGFIALVMPKTYESTLTEDLSTRALSLMHLLEEAPVSEGKEVLDRFAAENGVSITVYDEDGAAVYPQGGPLQGMDEAETDVSVSVVKVEDKSAFTRANVGSQMDGESTTSVSVDVYFADSTDVYKVSVSGSGREMNQLESALKKILPWLILSVLGVSCLAALLFSRYVTRPIVRLSTVSSRLAALDFDWQCDMGRRDEIGVLARDLNQLSQTLSQALAELRAANEALQDDVARERDLQRQRMQFFSAVSHELKTPITIIKGQLEGMMGNIGVYRDRDRYLQETYLTAQTMERMVEEMLTTFRLQNADFAPKAACVDFSALVDQSLMEHAILMEQQGLRIQSNVAGSLFVKGDAVLLRQAVDNLLVNAAQYSPAGEMVRIQAKQEEDTVAFSVENTGAHIPQDEIEHLFEAFYRGEPSRNRKTGGTGLGLHIVTTILRQHEARYRMENTSDGVRFSFTMARYTQST